MEYRRNQFQYGVAEAIRLVTELVNARRTTSGGTHAAIRTVATDCNITAAQVRRLLQPSRRPKDVGISVWLRITNAYRRYLLRQIAELEQELRVMAALGNVDPRTAGDLAAEAEALRRRIKKHL